MNGLYDIFVDWVIKRLTMQEIKDKGQKRGWGQKHNKWKLQSYEQYSLVEKYFQWWTEKWGKIKRHTQEKKRIRQTNKKKDHEMQQERKEKEGEEKWENTVVDYKGI